MKITPSFLALSLGLILPAHAQFTPGDLVILQAGDGGANINANGTRMLLNNFSLAGLTNSYQLALPTNGANSFITGSSPFTGMISTSADGHYIVLSGYNTPLPYSSTVEGAAASLVPRAIATVDSAGNFKIGAITTTKFTGTFRGAVSDGNGNFWAGGQRDGIQYLGTNFEALTVNFLPVSANINGGAIRDLQLVNGSIYFSTSQYPDAPSSGIAAFVGSPTSGATPALVIETTGTVIPGASGAANPKGFVINSNLTIAYVVDMRTPATGGGLYRFNGTGTGAPGSWTYAYTLANNLSSATFMEVTADFSGTNPKIYAITGTNSLVTATDTGAGSTFSLLATAPAKTAYRGLAFAPKPFPVPVTMSISRSTTQITVTWTGSGTLQSSDTIDGTYENVSGSPTSPYTTDLATGNRFYRIHIP